MRLFLRSFLCVFIAAFLLVAPLSSAAQSRRDDHLLRIAPAPPVFDEKDRLEELARRRSRVAQAIGPKAMLVLLSAEPKLYANNVSYHYRQENNLYYLTQLKQAGASLVLQPGNTSMPEILFLPRRSAFLETWSGRMYSAEEAGRISGVKHIWADTELAPFLKAVRERQEYQPDRKNVLWSNGAPTVANAAAGFSDLFAAAEKKEAELYLLNPGRPSIEYRREQQLATEWASQGNFVLRNALPIFGDLRLRKSPFELRLLQHAIDITIEAQQRAWLAAQQAKWEYEVDAHVLFTFKLRNADHWGYPPIIGCGPNATTLHYIESQGEIKPGDLLLMDVGAEYEHYTADITRTIPVSGRFTPAQAELYQIVFDAQEAAVKAIKLGGYVSDVDRAATAVIKEGLLKVGLITDLNSSQHRFWFMHGTSHWLGMNVHDVGNYGTRLEPGMVFTVEPGIYVRPDALDHQPGGWATEDWEKFKHAIRPAFEKYRGIGIRIEDDLLVTDTAPRWMSAALPRKLHEIEEFLARGR